MRTRLVVAAIAFGLPTGSASAQTSGGVRLEYAAPAECPSRESFLGEIGARTARLRMAEAEAASARTFVVTLQGASDRYEGSLIVRDAAGGDSERRVSGESCAVVGSALALVAALTIDPEASTAPLPAAGPLSVPPPMATEAPAAPAVESAGPIVASPSAAPAAPPAATAQLTSKDAKARFGAALGLGAIGFGDPVGTLGGPTLDLSVDLPGSAVFHPSLRAAPAFRLGASRFQSSTATVNGRNDSGSGTADFTFYRLGAEGCPLRLAFSASFDVRPCIVIVAGTVTGSGTVGTTVVSQTRPWFELGGSALVDWNLVGPFGLEGEAGLAGVPLRNEFRFNHPETHVFQAQLVLPELRLAARLRFP